MNDSFATPWTVALQAPLSMGFPRREHWTGLPFPCPGDFPDPGIEPGSPWATAWGELAQVPGSPPMDPTCGTVEGLEGEPPPHLDLYSPCPWLHSARSCPTLCEPTDCSPPGSSVHGISQARILQWVAVPSSRGASRPRDRTQVFGIVGGFFTT